MGKLGFALVALPLWIAGCSSDGAPRQAADGAARKQLLAEHKPYYDGVRQQLKAIAARLPAEGSLPATNKPFSVSPPLDSTAGGMNYEVLLEPQLVEPEFVPVSDHDQGKLSFDRFASDHLLRSLRWTGAKSEEFLATAPKRLDWSLKNGRDVRYVVVVRVVNCQPLKVASIARGGTGRPGLAGGVVDLEVFVADLQSGEVCGSFVVNSNMLNSPAVRWDGDLESLAYGDLIATLKELASGSGAAASQGAPLDANAPPAHPGEAPSGSDTGR